MLHQTVSGNDVLAQTVSYFPPFRLPEFLLGVVVGHALRVTPARVRSAALDTRREPRPASRHCLRASRRWVLGCRAG